MDALLLKDNDVLQWTPSVVLDWLKAVHMDNLTTNFTKSGIDGYTLIQLKESDLETHLKIESLGFRKNLLRAIYQLKALWIKRTGGAYGLDISEQPSLLQDSMIIGNQSTILKDISQLD